MKKAIALILAMVLTAAVPVWAAEADAAGEAGAADVAVEADAADATKTEAEPEVKGEGVMTYAEYLEAEVDDLVTIEAYVQAKQAFYENNEEVGTSTATIYAQDHDGGYFLYNYPCSAEDYEKLVPGTKIKATGYKAEWAGEYEIVADDDKSTFEIEEGTYIAEPVDVTDRLGKDEELAEKINQKVSFTGMTVEKASKDTDAAYMYNWDGSGQEGDDLYFSVSKDGATYSFVVESYLCDKDSDVYKAVKELKVGDTVDLEGFLYWYEGPNPHITSVKVK